MEATADKLRHDLRVVVEDAEELIKATAGDIGEKTRQARAKLAGALVVAKETCNRVEEQANASARAADRMIHLYPYEALGVAFVVGLVVGMLAQKR